MAPKDKAAVLILGGSQDDHARHVHDGLKARGVDVHYVDAALFPSTFSVSYDPVRRRGDIVLHGGRLLRFDEIAAVYWRNYNKTPNLYQAPIEDWNQAYIAQNDSRSLIESLLMGIDTRWVNGWEAYQLHQRKPYALSLVAAMGVRVPRTLCSNDPAALREFKLEEGDVIFKPIQGGAHTEKVESEALTDEKLLSLELSPITFQEEIKGTNVRVFVAGERVLACEVRTAALDFRDDPRPLINVWELPPAMVEQSLRIARRLALTWTGIDYRVTAEGEYVYLEANPSPMFMGFERATGLPLAAALLALLTP